MKMIKNDYDRARDLVKRYGMSVPVRLLDKCSQLYSKEQLSYLERNQVSSKSLLGYDHRVRSLSVVVFDKYPKDFGAHLVLNRHAVALGVRARVVVWNNAIVTLLINARPHEVEALKRLTLGSEYSAVLALKRVARDGVVKPSVHRPSDWVTMPMLTAERRITKMTVGLLRAEANPYYTDVRVSEGPSASELLEELKKFESQLQRLTFRARTTRTYIAYSYAGTDRWYKSLSACAKHYAGANKISLPEVFKTSADK